MIGCAPRPRPLLLLAAVWLAACNAGGEAPVQTHWESESEQPLSGRIAYLSVVSRNAFDPDGAPVSVTAQFVEFTGVDEATVRRSLGLWSPPPEVTLDQCWLAEADPGIAPGDWYASQIDLLHAGTLEVEAGDRHLALQPRPMPELLPYLSGYTYGTASDDRPLYRPGLPVEVWTSGGDGVAAFDVALEMPPAIAVGYVGGLAVGSAQQLDVDLGNDTLILWEPTSSGELVYLLIEEDGPEAGRSLVCAAFDDGAFQLSRAALAAVLDSASRPVLRLTLRRATQHAVELNGFDWAEAVAITEHGVVLY